jgi:UDP-glucose 4-epimerase
VGAEVPSRLLPSCLGAGEFVGQQVNVGVHHERTGQMQRVEAVRDQEAANGSGTGVFGVGLPTRDGSCIRDYVHVHDIAEAHLAAARYLLAGPRQAFEAVNLGSGSGSTVLEVIAAVERATGRELKWAAAGPREGDPVASTCDATRAAALLGWHAVRSLDEIAARPSA